MEKRKLLDESYKELEDKKEEIQFLYYNDTLTNIPNRVHGQKNLREIIAKNHSNKKIAVALMGADNFKHINETFNHNIGDRLLKNIGKRLLSSFTYNKVSRLGGDEFMVVIGDINSHMDVEKNVNRIMEEMKKDFHIEENIIGINCSIGVAIYPSHSTDIDSLYRYADIALMEVKRNGGNNLKIFKEDLLEKSYKDIQMKEKLMEAVRNHTLDIYYQPKVDIHNNNMVGCEALLRWNHPEKGYISPEYFIGLAEKYNLMKEIDNYVFIKVLKQLKNWIKEGFEPVHVAINISAERFYDYDFTKRVCTFIEEINIDTNLLNFEITETNIMKNPYKARETLNLIRGKGISISLDDFGTGYSSLNYLKLFPIDTLKIDKSFIEEICYDKVNRTIVEATITMAKVLDLKIVAEGIEEEEQLAMLKYMGCDEYQGYYFSKPIPAGEFELLLKKNSESSI
ncbi:MAG: bifunctional diguanylate cyclase/phosphodiesterase [Anaeromicrobium sp.]|nr:bifunctional diguanylate cyclase/phosphodiesterase [Anaeromicrobium sp.]